MPTIKTPDNITPEYINALQAAERALQAALALCPRTRTVTCQWLEAALDNTRAEVNWAAHMLKGRNHA